MAFKFRTTCYVACLDACAMPAPSGDADECHLRNKRPMMVNRSGDAQDRSLKELIAIAAVIESLHYCIHFCACLCDWRGDWHL